MTRRVPVVATLVVAAAIATMIALGVWQLHRLTWKEGLLARYAQAQATSADVAWPRDPAAAEAAMFRRSRIRCDRVLDQGAVAGRNLAGATGWAQTAHCALDGGGRATIALGWTRSPEIRTWAGGEIGGIVAPAESGSVRLIAGPPPAGLQQLAAPDPNDIPNNHLAYAIQWFLFAAVAAAVYAVALRKRLAAADPAR
jgi:surfeit locus 1 family protein